MAGNSLESLKAWMREASRTLGWDAIFALDGRELNQDLQRDHLLRLSQGNHLGTHDLEIPIPDTPVTHFLSGVRMAAPVLSFDKASLNTNRVMVHLPIFSASLMMIEMEAEQRKILRLARLDPLNGPHLTMEAPVASLDGNPALDLALGKDPLLELFQTAEQQREAGEHLLESLKTLSDAQRQFNLLTFTAGDNPYLHGHSIDARSQKPSPSSAAITGPRAVDEEGALLLFVNMKEGRSGDYPGNDSGYRYLLPDPAGDEKWTATALLSPALMHRATFASTVLQLLEDADFESVNDGAGTLTRLVAKSGVLQVPATTWQSADYQFESAAFTVNATGGKEPLTVEFHDDHALQRWQCSFAVTVNFRPVGGTTWTTYTVDFAAHLEHALRFYEALSEPAGMEAELSMPYMADDEITPVQGLPGSVDPIARAQLIEFVGQALKRALLVRFSEVLTSRAPDQLLEDVRVIGDSAFVPSHVAMPFDRAVFGRIHARGSSFSIVQPQKIVAAGKTLQLGVEPAREVTWTLENLSEDGSNPGTINADGLYRAPPRHAMQGPYSQVLAIASDSLSGETSVALITIQARSISLQPQFQTCFHGDRVELSAGHTGTKPLEWSIVDPVPGESGTLVKSDLPEGDHAYVAAPRVAGKAYVIDQIEVTDSDTNESESAWVLVIQHEGGATIKPVENPGLPPGQVQLAVWVNGRPVTGQWSLPAGGPGTIDASGLYTHNPQAQEPFALITVLVESAELGNFEGHIVLPLPLADFTTVLHVLAE